MRESGREREERIMRERESERRETKAEMRPRTAAHYALLLFLSIEIQ